MNDKEYLKKIHEKIEILETKKAKNKKIYNNTLKIAAVFVLAFTIGSLGIKSIGPKVDYPTISEDNNIKVAKNFSTLDSYENLKNLVKENISTNINHYANYELLEDISVEKNSINSSAFNSADTMKGEASSNFLSIDRNVSESESNSDYSTTNVQVQGVDEADIVKTDGKYIYYLIRNEEKVVITDVTDENNLKEVSNIEFKSFGYNSNFYPMQMYVDDNILVLIGTQRINKDSNILYDTLTNNKTSTLYSSAYTTVTKAICYDISDKKNIKESKTVEIDGNYNSSRKIGDNIYLISQKYINSYSILADDVKDEEILPVYKDSVSSLEYKQIDYSEIAYFPDFTDTTYTIIAGFNIKNNNVSNINCFLGNVETIYASDKNLYVVRTRYEDDVENTIVGEISKLLYLQNEKTIIYKFRLENGKTEFVSQGQVKGRILNQFSMDESSDGGYFRIATTVGDTWDEDNISKNNIYVLNDKLQVVGRLEDLAKGEKIYSTRFMGNRLYMVTFKEVDPLFVIDLSDPESPEVLGKLKIPGYSSYLHPYDETHIIGIGKDTKTYTTSYGRENTVEIGLKMALFDVSDVNNPKELYSIKIGDRGSYSAALSDHKAFLFSKKKNLIAFPATITKSYSKDSYGVPNYGKTVGQGAVVYNIDLETGFKLKGIIEHNQTSNNRYNYKSTVERVIYIKDNLFTMSNSMIKCNKINDLKEVNKLELDN